MIYLVSQRRCVCGAIVSCLLLIMLIGAVSFETRRAEAAIPLSQAEKDYLARKAEITYCIDPDRPPFSAVRKGRPEGMAVDLIEQLQKQLGLPFRFVSTDTWQTSLSYVQSDRCDILPGIDVMPSRHPFLSFTLPYFQYSVAIVTQTQTPFVTGVRDLRDRTVGLADSPILWEAMAQRFPYVPLVVVDHPRDGLEKVAAGDLDALIIPVPEALYHIRRLGLAGLKVAGHAGIIREMGIGVREELPMIRTILNKALGAVSEGEIDRIYRRQIPSQAGWRLDYRLFLPVLLAMLVIAGVLFFCRRKATHLKRRIAQVQAELEAKNEEIKMMAITDPLTCLNNRMRLLDILNKEMQRFQRYNRPVAIIMADVDNFKEINKEFGYNLGDVVLCKIGQALADNVRKADICGRWGGEKFMIICPETSKEGARVLAEHLRETIALIQLPKVGNRYCSFGVAAFIPEDTEESVLQRADKAQNLAMEKGGNRVETAE